MGDRIDIRVKKLIIESTPLDLDHESDTISATISATTTPIAAFMESVDTQIRRLTMNARIDALTIQSLYKRLTTLEAAFVNLTITEKEDNDMTQQEMQDLTDQIEAQTTVQAGLDTALATLTSTVTSAVQKIDDLAGQIAANANDPVAVASLIAQLKAHNDGLNTDMNAISAASTSLGAAVAANTNATTGTQDQVIPPADPTTPA